MDTFNRSVGAGQIAPQAVGKERCYRSHQFADSQQALIKSLIGSQLVGVHFSAPETFAVETYIPVRQIVDDEIADSARGTGGFVIGEIGVDFSHEAVEQ